MKIAILGTGSLGCYFAAKLHPVGEVHLFGHWEMQKEAIRKMGLHYQGLDGKIIAVSIRVSEISEYSKYFDLVLVLVKSFQTQQAAKEAIQLLNPDSSIGKVISLQNGLGNVEKLQVLFDKDQVIGGATNQAARVAEPGLVLNTGAGTSYLPKSTPLDIIALFEEAQIDLKLEADISGILWTKLAINAAINPLTSILQVPNGKLLEDTVSLKLMKALAAEVQAVAKGSGISLIVSDAGKEAVKVAEQTAQNRSSMLHDIDLGRQTEIDAICGSVIEQGEKVGVKTPLNRQVYRMVKAAESDTHYSLKDLAKLLG